LGNLAGYSVQAGRGNVFIGQESGYNETGNNRLYISNNQTTPLLYGVFSATPGSNKLGIGTQTVAASQAINVWNGAHLTTGGVWTNASSRELKDNIEALSAEDANAALEGLSPVRYVYKNSRDEEYVGFIAEDVPELVASQDHKSLSPMDIVAVLTTVAKNEKARIAELAAASAEQEANLASKDAEIAVLRDSLLKQEDRLLQLEMALLAVQRAQSPVDQVSMANAQP